MTTNTPMARAVEAGMAELGSEIQSGCDLRTCAENTLRAALPALLEAVVGEMAESDFVEVWLKGEYGGRPHKVATETMRAALLANLTDAAGRVK